MRVISILCVVLLYPIFATAVVPEKVVVLHGILRTERSMAPMTSFLRRQGFDVINVSYPSADKYIEDLVKEDVIPQIKPFYKTHKVHFVGYSMGGLLIRNILKKHRPPRVGRVVMMGTPNHGSEVADFLKDNPLYKTFYGPSGQQLLTDKNVTKHLYGPVNYELGVIAGGGTVDPLSSLILPGADDGKVTIESTKLDGMKAHIVVKSSHLLLPLDMDAWQNTVNFLKKGAFLPTPAGKSGIQP